MGKPDAARGNKLSEFEVNQFFPYNEHKETEIMKNVYWIISFYIHKYKSG